METFDLFTPEMLSDPTSCAAGSRASHSVMPGSKQARKMTATSGRKCAALLTNSDQVSSLVRTLLESSEWSSTRCYLTWKPSGTPRGRSLFRLSLSTPRTDEIESGSLLETRDGLMPTATGDTSNRKARYAQGGLPLPLYATATATATANQLAPSMMKHKGCRAMLPTPTTQDAANNGGASQYERNSLPLNAVVGGALNPTWVEWLMGFPPEWTALDASATPSSRKSRKSSAGQS